MALASASVAAVGFTRLGRFLAVQFGSHRLPNSVVFGCAAAGRRSDSLENFSRSPAAWKLVSMNRSTTLSRRSSNWTFAPSEDSAAPLDNNNDSLCSHFKRSNSCAWAATPDPDCAKRDPISCFKDAVTRRAILSS